MLDYLCIAGAAFSLGAAFGIHMTRIYFRRGLATWLSPETGTTTTKKPISHAIEPGPIKKKCEAEALASPVVRID